MKIFTLSSSEFQENFLPAASQETSGSITDVSIVIHENELPPFLGKTLDELYGSLFSSMPHLEAHQSLHAANAYIATRGSQVIAALIFRRHGHEVTVVNEVFRIRKEEIARFANHIFSTYRSVKKITFNAISCEAEDVGYAMQRFPGTEYIIAPLPSTEDEYTARLGKATRKNIKHHLSRLKRTFPSFVHEVQEAGNISEADLLAIIEFNKMRMADKHKIVHLSQEEIERLTQVAMRCGFLSLIRIDGQVCAGAICFQTGKTVTSHVNAHHPQYNQYRLGTLSCYLAICESIRREAAEFNLEWGAEEYKYSLLGVDRPYDHIVLYRSYVQLLSDAKAILKIRASNGGRAARIWLLEQSKKDGYFAKCLNFGIGWFKRKKYSQWLERSK